MICSKRSHALEARAADFDVLIACAFNYEACATEFSKFGRIPVLKARMSADLHTADDLKNTGKGNLFVIFGEPDITIPPKKLPYAIDRYVNETARLYAVPDKRLADREFVAGEYFIADMASHPWIVPHERQKQNLADFPNLKRWFEAIRARPVVVCANEKGRALNTKPVVDEKSRTILFGQSAQTVRKSPG